MKLEITLQLVAPQELAVWSLSHVLFPTPMGQSGDTISFETVTKDFYFDNLRVFKSQVSNAYGCAIRTSTGK